MNRRGFLQRLAIGVGLAPYLPKLLDEAPRWFTPKYYEVPVAISLDEINVVTMREIMPVVSSDSFFASSPLLAYLREHKQSSLNGVPIQAPLIFDAEEVVE